MQRCPKCGGEYGDDSKICRVCGAILQTAAVAEVPGPQPPAAASEEASGPPTVAAGPPQPPPRDAAKPWTCSHCGQSVPAGFEVCWNCGTTIDGQTQPDFRPVEDEDDAAEELAEEPEEDTPPEPERQSPYGIPRIKRSCPKCGSKRIVRGARVHDGYSRLDVQVVVYADPEALLFKDAVYRRLVADVCGDCGHAELRVEDPGGLYDHYRRSRE